MIIRAAEAEVLALGDIATTLLTDGAISASRTAMAKGTDGPSPHYHKTSPEAFFIIDGGLQVLVGDTVEELGTGDFLLVPPNTTHAFATPENTGVDMLFLMVGIERFGYFRLLDRIARGEASSQEVLANQDRFDNHFLDSETWRTFRDSA
jgi:mannose-6-phosphate isomerase-like protein (cupin superfamily)